ncbi:hypothetical protein ACLOJK_018183 [Asimina triloba]
MLVTPSLSIKESVQAVSKSRSTGRFLSVELESVLVCFLLAFYNKQKMLKVQVISREMMKPSTPTPPHLRSYKLTLIDRYCPASYVPFIFFYPNNEEEGPNTSSSAAEKIRKLKQSLSETLTLYYPLAGRMPDKETEGECNDEAEGVEVEEVECNDQGLELCEARVEGRLSDLLRNPYMEVLDRLVPCNYLSPRSGVEGAMPVQLNVFDCGEIAVGVSAHHQVLDGVSLVQFMNAWASASRGGCQVQAPLLHASELFPTQGFVPPFHARTKGNIVGRRFVFDAAKIEALRAGSDVTAAVRPTRVEAVSAIIWKCMMQAHRDQLGGGRVSLANQTVDLRRRMSPPAPPALFGNVISLGSSMATEADWQQHDVQRCLEGKMREAIKEVDDRHHISVLQQPDGIARLVEASLSKLVRYDESKVDLYPFSSWCGFPFYEVDFGWGKPAWVSACTMVSLNLVVLLNTRDGDGIEAWVSMEDVLMARLVQDQELLRYATSD